VLKSFVEKKKKLQDDVARMETEIAELRAEHEVSFLYFEEVKVILDS